MAIYDLAIFHGHGEGDVGAVGQNYTELERVKLLTTKVVSHLKNKNMSILTNVESGANNYNKNLTKGHTLNYKMAFSFHINSATVTARGSEIIVPMNESYLNLEEKILNGLVGLGFTNRGLKSRDYNTEKWVTRVNGSKGNGVDWYREVREAWNNGISLSIIEFCFISNKEDIELFNKKIDDIALMVANCILEYCGKEVIVPSVSGGNSDTWYRVITGSFRDRANAEQRIKELKSKGFDSFIEIK